HAHGRAQRASIEYRDSRHLIDCRRGDHGHLHRRHADPGAHDRLQLVQLIPCRVRLGARGSAAWSAGNVVRRWELANTEDGDLSGELGAAVSGPISDTLAYRVSSWFRRDGGSIDRVNWD